MFYHTALLFDYENFSKEAKPLGLSIEKGNIKDFDERIFQITSTTNEEDFILKDLGFGEPIKNVKPLVNLNEIQFLNSEIGKRFLVLMSQYLFPCSLKIGYSWRKLVSVLERMNWSSSEITTLIYGDPIGKLVSDKARDALPIDKISHQDPFWRWIRPMYSYNQGGWVSYRDCVSLYDKLNKVKNEQLSQSQNPDEEESEVTLIQNTKTILSYAIKEQKGLYVIVLWEE